MRKNPSIVIESAAIDQDPAVDSDLNLAGDHKAIDTPAEAQARIDGRAKELSLPQTLGTAARQRTDFFPKKFKDCANEFHGQESDLLLR